MQLIVLILGLLTTSINLATNSNPATATSAPVQSTSTLDPISTPDGGGRLGDTPNVR